jgi:hypothetical protein
MIEKTTTKCPNRIRAEFFNGLEPVIMTDAADAWAAFSAWSFPYLQQLIGHKPAMVGDRPLKIDGKPVTIGTLIKKILSEDAEENRIPYLRAASIPLHYPELIPDLQPSLRCLQPNWMALAPEPRIRRHLSTSKLGFPELLIGATNRGVPELHFDRGFEHALVTQVIGSKEFLLFPPEDTAKLYPREPDSNLSQIPNPFEPDLSEFPEFANANPLSVLVQPGETIFIPSGWWHVTRSLEPTVGITFNLVTRVNWRAFSNYRACQIRSNVKRGIFKSYMHSLGAVQSVTEYFRVNNNNHYWP